MIGSMSRWRWKGSASICVATVCLWPSARRLLAEHGCWVFPCIRLTKRCEAEAQGADYIVLGPIYDTPSKQMFGPPLGLSSVEEACRAGSHPGHRDRRSDRRSRT